MKKLTAIELIVTGYNRLALSDSKEYVVRPDNIHLILGTNGCGKSSLLSLMTPLPPDSKYFSEDGTKIYKFMYGDDMYVTMYCNNKHSMYKNNEVIVENVGIQMMTEYVKEYFGITPDIHKFMLGKINLCSMSLQNRKEFISNISGIDFDYVNKLYNNLKKQLRDNTGVVKYINNNILSMKEYILSDDEVDKMIKEKDDIKKLLIRLHENKRPDKNLSSVEKPDMIKIMKRLESVIDSISEYSNNIDDIKSKYILYTAKSEEYNKKLLDISNILTKINDNNASDIINKIKEISDKISILKNSIVLPIEYLKDTTELLKYREPNIISIINQLSLSLSGESYDSITNNINDIDSKLLELSNKQKELDTDIDNTYMKITTYRSAMNGLSCPDCGFHFKEDSVSDIIKKLEAHIEDIHSPKNHIEKEIIEYKSISEDLNNKAKDRDKLERLLEYIKPRKDYTGYDYTNTFINYSNVYSFSILLIDNIKQYEELVVLEKEYEELSKKDVDSKEEEIITLSKEYETLSSNIDDISINLNKFKKIIDNYNQMNEDIVIVNKYLNDANKNRRYKINSLFNKASNELIFELNNKLSKIESILDKYNYMSKSTNENLKELEKVNKDIELLEIIIKELSPSTGLIAESIKSFLVGYIKDVNIIINNVWSYDVEVLPYDVKELEKGISYRFPVKVNDQKPTPDINDTSESMREIINIAFRIVSLKYMGLLRHPLLIDEFGRSMDEIHLIKSYDLLENISTENDIQMFIIAHIKAAYNRFKNSGISIISSLNLEDME